MVNVWPVKSVSVCIVFVAVRKVKEEENDCARPRDESTSLPSLGGAEHMHTLWRQSLWKMAIFDKNGHTNYDIFKLYSSIQLQRYSI